MCLKHYRRRKSRPLSGDDVRPGSVRYPPANAVLEVNVKVLVFFQNTRRTRGKKSSIRYLVHIIGRTKNKNHKTLQGWWSLTKGSTQQARAHRGHEWDTEPMIKQGNNLGVRLQKRDGSATRYLVGASPPQIGSLRPWNFNMQSSIGRFRKKSVTWNPGGDASWWKRTRRKRSSSHSL